MFCRAPASPTTAANPSARVDPLHAKEAKWGTHRDELLRELAELATKGWIVAYTDGSAKKVRGWMQAGYGIWFGMRTPANLVAQGGGEAKTRVNLEG